MAKLSKKKRKQQKQKQVNRLLAQGYKEKEIRQLSNAEIEKASKANISQKQGKNLKEVVKIADRREKDRKRKAKQRAKIYSERSEKLQLLEKIIGADSLNFEKNATAKFIDSLSLEDLQKGKYKRSDFKEYIPKEKLSAVEKFDFNKVYQVPNGKKLHFAYRSLSGEKDIGEQLHVFEKYSNEELLSYLKAIKDMPRTGSKNVKGSKGRRVGSSGQAGEGICRMYSQNALTELYNTQRNADRRSNTYTKLLSKTAQKRGVNFQHSGIDYHWQNIRQQDENGRLKAYTEITGRKLLIIGNAILWNITEADRAGFYNEFYSVACEIIPEFKNILP